MTSRRILVLALIAMLGTSLNIAAQPTVGPPVRVDVAGGNAAANETSASASDIDPQHLVMTWNDWRDSTVNTEFIRLGVALSLDGGGTWTDAVLRPPIPFQADVEGDPMAAFDPRTGTLWVGAISFAPNGGIFIARKDPGATTFAPSTMAHVDDSTDKGWMVAGQRFNEPDTTRLFIAFNDGVIFSDDMGDTFSSAFGLGFGVGFLPRVGPNGEFYAAYWDYDENMFLKRNLSGGTTFTTHTIAVRMDVWDLGDSDRIPGTFRVPQLAGFDVDRTDGTLYAVFCDTTDIVTGDANVDVYFTRSTDQGTTWTTPTVLNGEGPNIGDQFFPWLEVDAAGRVHVVFIDSRHTTQTDDEEDGMFDAYYAYSLDQGDTWSEIRLTPTSWSSEADGLDRPFQFLGDYLGMAVADNAAYPCYLDSSNGDTDIYTREIAFSGFVRGDVDADGAVNALSDGLFLLEFGFLGGATPTCMDAADIDDDGTVNPLADGLALLQFGFLMGPPPAPPHPDCGADPTADAIDCDSFTACP